jgi:predicted DNA binding CopG/RHH family protein
MSNKGLIPAFKTEDEEAEFWLTHDITEYFDEADEVTVDFPNLRPSTQSVTIRLPKPLIYSIKLMANEQDVPYQSLLKTLLNEKVNDKLAMKRMSAKK